MKHPQILGIIMLINTHQHHQHPLEFELWDTFSRTLLRHFPTYWGGLVLQSFYTRHCSINFFHTNHNLLLVIQIFTLIINIGKLWNGMGICPLKLTFFASILCIFLFLLRDIFSYDLFKIILDIIIFKRKRILIFNPKH